MADANIRAVITAEDKASAVVKGFGKNIDDTSKNISGGLNASVIAVGAATAGIVAFGKKSLDAFNTQDLAITRLQAGINNVKTATDKHINSLIKQAQALQKTTRFSDEAYISAQGILSTFQLNQKAIEKLTPRLADMAEGLARVDGTMPDLEGNAILVAKALGGEDVVGLVGALRRVGVVMTKTQTEMLQTGTQEQRLAVITQVLDQNFQGMATAAGGTTAGKLAELKNQFNDLQEKVGQLIAEALTPLLNILLAHPAVLATVTGAIGALTVAFIALKISAAIAPIISIATVSIQGLTAATTAAYVQISAMSALSLAGWAAGAAASVYAVVQAIQTMRGAIDAVNASARAANNLGSDEQVRELQKQAAAARAIGDTKRVNQIANAIAALSGGRAEGGPVMAGRAYLVGERGPEIVVPSQSGTVIPNNKIGGSVLNVSFSGIFTGSQQEFRQLAIKLHGALQDAKGMGTM